MKAFNPVVSDAIWRSRIDHWNGVNGINLHLNEGYVPDSNPDYHPSKLLGAGMKHHLNGQGWGDTIHADSIPTSYGRSCSCLTVYSDSFNEPATMHRPRPARTKLVDIDPCRKIPTPSNSARYLEGYEHLEFNPQTSPRDRQTSPRGPTYTSPREPPRSRARSTKAPRTDSSRRDRYNDRRDHRSGDGRRPRSAHSRVGNR